MPESGFVTLPISAGRFKTGANSLLQAEKYTHFVWSENLLFVSRCYAIKKNKELAIKYLQKAETIECPDEATKEALSEVRSMIAKIK